MGSRREKGAHPEYTGRMPGGRDRGRPSSLTEETSDRIINAIRAGNYLETAAAFAGVTGPTVRAWTRRGAIARKRREQGQDVEEAERLFEDFFEAVLEAEASAEVRDVALIGKAAAKDWKAAAWRLQHRTPERWGRNVMRVEHDLAEGAEVRGAEMVRRLRGDPETRRALDLLARSMEGNASIDGGEDVPGGVEAEAPSRADQ